MSLQLAFLKKLVIAVIFIWIWVGLRAEGTLCYKMPEHQIGTMVACGGDGGDEETRIQWKSSHAAFDLAAINEYIANWIWYLRDRMALNDAEINAIQAEKSAIWAKSRFSRANGKLQKTQEGVRGLKKALDIAKVPSKHGAKLSKKLKKKEKRLASLEKALAEARGIFEGLQHHATQLARRWAGLSWEDGQMRVVLGEEGVIVGDEEVTLAEDERTRLPALRIHSWRYFYSLDRIAADEDLYAAAEQIDYYAEWFNRLSIVFFWMFFSNADQSCLERYL